MYPSDPDDGDQPVDRVSQLGCLFAGLERERRIVEARITLVVGEADRLGVFAADGHATVKGWCRALAKWSPGETLARLRAARLMHASPELAQAAIQGAVGVAQLHAMGRAFANPRCGHELLQVVPLFLEHAQHLSFHDFELVVRRWEMLADTDGAYRDHDSAHRDRTASVTEADTGIVVRAQGGIAQGVSIMEIFQRYVDAEFAADWADTVAAHGDAACTSLMPRTDAQRRFDAFHRVFLDAVSTPAHAQHPEPVVNIVVSLDTLEACITGEQGDVSDPRWCRSETTNGVLVDPRDILAAALVGHIRRVVIDSAGVIVDMGRKRRLFTGNQRQAVLMGSTRCIWPGCDQTSGRCQADHLAEWQHHGETNLANAAPLCPRHNRWKTRGYSIHRDANGYWHTTRPNNTEIS